MKKLLYLIVGVCICCSCEEGEKMISPQSYIGIYHGGKLKLWVSTDDRICLDFNEEKYCAPDWTDGGHNLDEFKRIATRNGDMNFFRETSAAAYSTREAYADNFLSINIVSDADWDETHRAGTSLNDIFEFSCVSLSAYIKSGYNNIDAEVSYGESIHKRVDLLTLENMAIIRGGSFWWPFFTALSNPTLDKNHKITVTIMTVDGEKKEASVDMEY